MTDAANGRVLRIDPQTNQVTQPINVGTGPGAITVGDGSVWVANSLDGTVSRIDPQTNQVAAAISVGDGPSAIAVGAGGVWVANEFGGSVARIDPATGAVARTIIGRQPSAWRGGRGRAGVGERAGLGRQPHRGGTLTVLQHGPFGSLDPTVAASLASILTLYMTNDGLTAFKRVGGSDGAQLVPDLATSVPTPTDGGLHVHVPAAAAGSATQTASRSGPRTSAARSSARSSSARDRRTAQPGLLREYRRWRRVRRAPGAV